MRGLIPDVGSTRRVSLRDNVTLAVLSSERDNSRFQKMPPNYTIDALYAVGRNLLNFQRLEQILKGLALTAPICAPLSTLQNVVETRKAKSERLTFLKGEFPKSNEGSV
jgi:hypothetical protein